MKKVLIIGSGIAGMSAAVRTAELGMNAILVSPFPSERSQSVMASGGINAVFHGQTNGDTVDCHIEDTLKSGCGLSGKEAVSGLCGKAEEIISFLERIGTVFTTDSSGHPAARAFGGQSYSRTRYSGSSTGKQIVSAMVMETRRWEAKGMIERYLWKDFHSGLIDNGICYGALLYDEASGTLAPVYADAVIMATGGQNALFGKTTGSTQCDGYAAGRLFMQGAELKNLEFIQYHPTTVETPQKRMLISEAARGEGGRLFFLENGRKRYFMEEKYGKNGNLMNRDLMSREINSTGKQVYLDLTELDEEIIRTRLPEVQELCKRYIHLDVSKEPIPIAPSVHFFMGGLAVHLNHETNLKNLYAVGECASLYHGANRLGGNSLLAALYSGRTAAEDIAGRSTEYTPPDFQEFIEEQNRLLQKQTDSDSTFPVMYIRQMAAENMNTDLGILRNEEALRNGIQEIDYCLSIADRIHYDSSVLPYFNYSLTGILTLARAVLTCAQYRKESRGAHYRSDFPETKEEYSASTIIAYDNGNYRIYYDREKRYES